MEAKVDVRKLQILNDRINQTIDALNQVRLSVHGLGHTGGLQSQFSPFGSQGYGMQQPFGMVGGPGYGLQQGLQGFPGFIPQTPFGSPFGFQHSPLQSLINPYLTQGLNTPWSQIGYPFGNTPPWHLFGQGGIGGVGGFGVGLGQQYGGGIGTGLYHSGTDVVDRQLAEARANDPFRITQTFPFVIS